MLPIEGRSALDSIWYDPLDAFARDERYYDPVDLMMTFDARVLPSECQASLVETSSSLNCEMSDETIYGVSTTTPPYDGRSFQGLSDVIITTQPPTEDLQPIQTDTNGEDQARGRGPDETTFVSYDINNCTSLSTNGLKSVRSKSKSLIKCPRSYIDKVRRNGGAASCGVILSRRRNALSTAQSKLSSRNFMGCRATDLGGRTYWLETKGICSQHRCKSTSVDLLVEAAEGSTIADVRGVCEQHRSSRNKDWTLATACKSLLQHLGPESCNDPDARCPQLSLHSGGKCYMHRSLISN